MSSNGKITTISFQIDLGAIEPIINSLDFQTIVLNGHTFHAAQGFNQFNFGHHKKWVIDVDKCSLQLILCMLLSTKKKSQWGLASNRFPCIIWILGHY